MTDLIASPPAADGETPASWHRILRKVGLVYIYSRLCVLAGAAIVAAELRADVNNTKGLDLPFADPQLNGHPFPNNAVRPILDVLSSWDGLWYIRIIRFGYPRHVQDNVTYNVIDARAAFFPMYPILVRWVDKVIPGGDTVASLATNFVLGGLAIFLLGLVARKLYGPQVAAKAMVLGAVFPGSFVLSFSYSEALLLVFAMGCLWYLLAENWVASGVLAALGTATRPNGLALVLACAVASFIAIRTRRQWSSLAAPLLAPLGFVLFQLWLGWHADEAGVWFRVQTRSVGRGRQLRLDRGEQDHQSVQPAADLADQHHHGRVGRGDGVDAVLHVAQAPAVAGAGLLRRGHRHDVAAQHGHGPAEVPVHRLSAAHLGGRLHALGAPRLVAVHHRRLQRRPRRPHGPVRGFRGDSIEDSKRRLTLVVLGTN